MVGKNSNKINDKEKKKKKEEEERNRNLQKIESEKLLEPLTISI